MDSDLVGDGAPAHQPPLSARGLSASLEQLVRLGLRGVWLRGELPPSGCIWAANHHSWWDGFLASAVLRRLHRPAALLMDGDNLGNYAFLAPLGVIPASRPRQALQALRQGRVLVIYPEAALRPPGPVGELAPGAAWLARQSQAPLLPVAVRVVARGHQYAEAFVDLGPTCRPEELQAALTARLAALDAALAAGDPREPLPGFDRLLAGRLSWDERIDRWSGLLNRRARR